jgi:DNA-binding transcriptional LysR family regulator
MQDLKSVRVFLEVADRLSFASAARALQMTPASVTRIVAALEKEFGQQLLVRTTRQVSLTSAGSMVAERFRPVVEAFDRASQDILRAGNADLGRLRISAPLSLGIRVLPPLIEGFRLAYPRIDLDLQLTDRLVDIIAEDCDLAIRVSGPPSDKSTIWRKICEIPRSLVAAPALFERIVTPGHPDDLDPAFMLSYSETGRPESWLLRRGDEARSLRAGSGLKANNGDFLCRLAEEGGGICLLPDFIVRDGLQSGRLVRVLPNWHASSLWLTLYYPPYARLPPLVATFSDFFEDFMRGLDGMEFGAS